MSVVKRIAASLGANTFAQLITTGSQIILTPLFFKFWGAELYGEWLLLTSLSSYLSMSDLGFGSAAANEMALRTGAGDMNGAQRVFFTAKKMALLAALVAMALGGCASAIKLFYSLPPTANFDPFIATTIIFLMASIVALGFFGGVIGAAFRSCGQNARGLMYSNIARIFELFTMVVALSLNSTPIKLAIVMVISRMVTLIVQWTALKRACRWLFLSDGKSEPGLIKKLILPSIGFLALPFGNAIAIQGPILIIGSLFGGASVAVYSTLRTMARVPIQLTTVLTYSTWPELSFASGANNILLMQKIHRTGFALTFGASIPIIILLFFSGPFIIRLWIGESATCDQTVFGTLLIISLFNVAWTSSSVVLAATNRIARTGTLYLAVNLIALVLSYIAGKYFGWTWMLISFVISELLMILFVIPQSLKITEDRISLFIKNLIPLLTKLISK